MWKNWFGTMESLAKRNPDSFANDGESLFDALSHVAIDFRGKSAGCDAMQCDLSRFCSRKRRATFSSRDELFNRYPLFQKSLPRQGV